MMIHNLTLLKVKSKFNKSRKFESEKIRIHLYKLGTIVIKSPLSPHFLININLSEVLVQQTDTHTHTHIQTDIHPFNYEKRLISEREGTLGY